MNLFQSTAEAAFVTDEAGRVLHWNVAATHLLGYREEDVLGKSCCGVLRGVDFAGNSLCSKNCQVLRMLLRGEPLHHFQMAVRNFRGRFRWVTACVLAFQVTDGGLRILHVLWPPELDLDSVKLEQRSLVFSTKNEQHGSEPSATEAPPSRNPLTPREVEVLRKVAAGESDSQIADDLSISVNTVKSHLQSSYRKLGVRRRWKAVVIALRHQLI